jgi:hypothetical protein
MGPTITLTSLHRLKVPQVSLTTDIATDCLGLSATPKAMNKTTKTQRDSGCRRSTRDVRPGLYEALQAKSAGR